jgi:hypothetical protein
LPHNLGSEGVSLVVSDADPLPGTAAMRADYRQFQAEVGPLIVQRRLDPGDLTHSDYLFVVRDWLQERGAEA